MDTCYSLGGKSFKVLTVYSKVPKLHMVKQKSERAILNMAFYGSTNLLFD